MIPQNIIELARKGGWISKAVEPTYIDNYYEVICSPLFWQALGKELGWKTMYAIMGESGGYEADDFFIEWVQGDDDFEKDTYDEEPEWKYRAKEFDDLILTGGDTAKFWEELTNN